MTAPDRDDTTGPTEQEAEFLIRSGTFTRERLDELAARVERGELAALEERTRREGIEASLSLAEVADRLGIDDGEIMRRLQSGDLAAFEYQGDLLFPAWQFTDDAERPVLPNLAAVVTAFEDDWSPAGLLGFMSTAHVDTEVDGNPVTPGAWLMAGGDPQELRDILDSFLMC